MSNIWWIARRELVSAFTRPLAYIFVAIFLLACGIIFGTVVFQPGQEASMSRLFMYLVMMLWLVVPILTMPLISEELSRGTIETMMTAPITDVQLVIGKFLGVFLFYIVLLATTLVYVILLAMYGDPAPVQAVIGYVGMLLVGTTFISIGLFFSSLTRDQLLAALLGAVVLVALTLGAEFSLRLLSGRVREIVAYVSVSARFNDFSRGIMDTGSLIYFVGLTAFFLFVTVKVVESRRWR